MLIALALGIAGLVVLGLAALALGTRPLTGRLVHGGCLVLCAGLAGLAVAALLGGAGEVLALPFGPAWSTLGGPALLALDGLSAWFLLLLGLTGAMASLHAGAAGPQPLRSLVALPLFLAGMALTLGAADGFLLLLGFEAMSLASWALVAQDHQHAENRVAARLYLIFALLAGACLVPAFGLLAGHAGGLDFATLRAAPPEGWLAGAVLALGLAGAGAKAGLVPLHAWLPLAHPAAPSHVSALMSGAMTKVALYVLARLLLDLCGPAQPSWWGLPLLALGAASALLGALRANLEDDIKTLLACSTIENIGFITMAFGLVLAFRGADLGTLAALAAAAGLLHALGHGVFKTLLFLVAGAVLHAAGSRRIDRLGGLIHAIPATALAALVGVAAAAALPPLSGFAGEWLLLQALLAGWRVAEIGFQVSVAAATAVAAMAAALAAAAMVRFYGLVFLGRPRSPRGAGAQEVHGAERWSLLLPAAVTVIFGLFPGVLVQLSAPAVQVLAGPAARPPGGWWALSATEGGAAYYPLGLALLLGLAGAGLVLALRQASPGAAQRGPVWNGGFIDPPAHLPFGDPLTQPTAAGIAQPLRRMLGASLLAARESVAMPRPGDPAAARYEASFADPSGPLLLVPLARAREAVAIQAERLRGLSIRGNLSLAFGLLVGLLALLAWLEAR